MSPSPPALLLALLLLGTASTVWAQPSPCQTGRRRIELKEGAAPPPEICISPGLVTSLLFDRELAPKVELEGRPRFERVEAMNRSMLLMPSEKLAPGERLQLTVRFTGTAAPASASFILVVYRDEADRQVDIFRAPRSSESCQAEIARKEEELQSCLQGQPPPALGGLARLLADGAFEDHTLPPRPLDFPPPVLASGAALQVKRLRLYVAKNRLVLEANVMNNDPSRPLRLASAAVTGASGQPLEPLDVVLPKPIPPRKNGSIWVEVTRPDENLPGTYSLQVWDEDKVRTFTLSGLNLR
ncbi:DUF2381 family protein [Hyalangium minutum]|uniref:DUF2381 family protein n=1 Tax=Hyalangium minutum TaxID=394096 RepID=A0A085WLN4_9BACT|nr:DUF2381 family protein [Hyalangium minutum]KFE68597.1 hypothetical protein DB31_7834 [Hyalangium minutum]